jgi:penicillin-binding protein 1A
MAKTKRTERREPIFDVAPARPAPAGKRAGKRRRGGSGIGRILYWGVVASLWCVIAGIGILFWVAYHLPPIESLEVPKRPPSVQIVALDGRVLANRGEMGGAAIPLREMPAYLPKAFVAIEDRRFYHHYGVDPIGLMRAVLANALHRGVAQGGSTITQQLAKNLFLTPERTLTRKLQEVVLALWLEHKYSKNQIIELYLNRVYFGAGAYGVEAAAQRYFGKSARHVTLAEAALLAGLVKSPSRLSPTKNFDGAEDRAQLVLAAMRDGGFIDAAGAKVAMEHPPHIAQASGGGSVNYVADWVMDVVNDLIGHVDHDIVVETTIDPSLQQAAEKALDDVLAQKGAKFAVTQGALVAMTPEGAVRALVGGRNYAESQFNRAIAAKRQPGSSFKPFVYLTALERGLTPDTVREDKPIDIRGWHPENYERQYYGPVTLTQALALSLNTVSVRLTLECGPAAVAKTAYRLGITSTLAANPSLALGTSEVSPLELVGAYAPFANGGTAVVPHVVARVRSADGKQLLYTSAETSFGRVVDARYIAMMNTMMRQTLVMGTAKSASLPGWIAAGKTGTSQDFRDAWFVGYTAHMVTGVWLGNDDSSPTRHATGGGLPVEVWSRFMRVAHQNVPVASLPGLGNGGGWFAGTPVASTSADRLNASDRLVPPAPTSDRMVPPAPIAANNVNRNVRPEADHGLDGWFLDRLFGRR